MLWRNDEIWWRPTGWIHNEIFKVSQECQTVLVVMVKSSGKVGISTSFAVSPPLTRHCQQMEHLSVAVTWDAGRTDGADSFKISHPAAPPGVWHSSSSSRPLDNDEDSDVRLSTMETNSVNSRKSTSTTSLLQTFGLCCCKKTCILIAYYLFSPPSLFRPPMLLHRRPFPIALCRLLACLRRFVWWQNGE